MTAAAEKPKHLATHAVFAPMISEYEIPGFETLNRELVRDIVNWSKEGEGITRTNVSGWHSDGNIFKRTEPFFVEICWQFVEACKPTFERYLTREVLKTRKLELEGWVNINPPRAYNQMHTHDRYDLSGVYYAKVPEPKHKESGALQFLNPSYRGGPYSELFNAMHPTKFTVKPKEGTMLVFPSAMPHWVLPNDDSDDRMSIAFNVRLKKADEPA